MISTDSEISKEKLGYAKVVEERKFGNEKLIVVEGCKNPMSVSIVARAPTEMMLEELEKSLRGSVGAVMATVEDCRIVLGGGATEIELAERFVA